MTSREPEFTASSHTPNAEPSPMEAYERMANVFGRIPAKSLLVVNANIPELVQTVLGAATSILELRPQLAKVASFDISTVDTLKDAAQALAWAHSHHRCHPSKRVDLASIARQQRKVRRQLLAATVPFVAFGLLNGSRLEKFNRRSYQSVAFDVLALVELFLSRWDDFAGKTPLSKEQLELYKTEAQRFVFALGTRKTKCAITAAAALAERQAFTLVVRNYTDIRATLQFLRREQGDVELIAPSLFRSRGKRAVKAKQTTP